MSAEYRTSFAGTSFWVWRNDDGSVPYWSSAPVYDDKQVPGGSRVITQMGGFGLEQLEVVALFRTFDDWKAMRALETTEGELADYPSPGRETFPTVRLRQAGTPSPYVVDDQQRVRTTLTFSRRRPS